MNDVLLISENKVRTYSNISTNTQTSYLLPAIREAQTDYELIIGSKLYNKIISLVENGDIKKEENYKYKNLLDKSQFYLLYNTISKICVIANYHIDNFGITTSTDEHIQSLSMNDVLKMKDLYEKKAESHLKRLQMFILNFKNDYPELCDTQINEFRSNLYSATNTSIWLGGVRGRGYYKNNQLRNKYE